MISEDQIFLSCDALSKEEAIEMIGRQMVTLGHTDEKYITEMLQREEVLSTYIGNGIAVPHGIKFDSDSIKKSGVIIAQFPNGIPFGKHKAYLLIGIAGKGEEQVQTLSTIAEVIEDEQKMKCLWSTRSKDQFLSILRR